MARGVIEAMEAHGHDLLEALQVYRDFGTVGAAAKNMPPEQVAQVDRMLARYLELTPGAEVAVVPAEASAKPPVTAVPDNVAADEQRRDGRLSYRLGDHLRNAQETTKG